MNRTLAILLLTVFAHTVFAHKVQAQTPAQQAALAEKAALAKSYLASERFAEAAKIYGELAQALPGNAGLLLNHGMALHLAGEDRAAIAPLQATLKLNPGALPAQLFLGASLLRTGQAAAAITPLEKYAAADPQHREVRQMLVDACSLAGQSARALPHLERLAQLDPERTAVWYELGRAYEALAAETFEKLGKAFPESGPWFALVADSRSKTSQNRAAFLFYRKAIAKAPALRGLHAALAEIYTRTDHADWAATERAAEAKLGKPVCAAVKTAECEFTSGRFASVLALARPTADGHYWRIRAYDMLARQSFARLLELPESPERYRFQAETQRDQGKHAPAIAAWKDALRLAPGHPDFQRELAASLLAAREYLEAQLVTSQLLIAEPQAADLQHLQGDLFLAQQQAEAAIPYLEKAVALDPRLLPARASLARALAQAGRPADALPHATAALPLDSDGSLHFQLARAYQAAGQHDAAQKAMAQYQQIQAKLRASEQAVEKEAQITAPPP